MSDGDDLFLHRSFISAAPPSKIVDIDIRDIDSSETGLQISSWWT